MLSQASSESRILHGFGHVGAIVHLEAAHFVESLDSRAGVEIDRDTSRAGMKDLRM